MNEKQILRQNIRNITLSLALSYKIKAGDTIGEKVVASSEFSEAEKIFVYLSSTTEPETRYIIKKALETGKKVYVPLCVSKGIMKMADITTETVFTKGYMGISEPVGYRDFYESEIDLAIIPCLCASYDGKRLGHGAGFYDRFLENRKCVKICLCFDRLINDNIPVDNYDVRMDKVITEERTSDCYA